jgi:hypothetical protein
MKLSPSKILWIGCFAFFAYLLFEVAYSGTRRMNQIRRTVTQGLDASKLPSFLGSPVQVLHAGDTLKVARRGYQLPQIDQATTVYVYAKDAIPYFNVYVFIDRASDRVTRADIENLWW